MKLRKLRFYLRKVEVTVEEDGKSVWGSEWLNPFIFYREAFWFSIVLPELGKLVSEEQVEE